MQVEHLLEVLAQHLTPHHERTAALLRDAVSSFSSNTAAAVALMRQIQDEDPSGFALAALRLLEGAAVSGGEQYLANLLFRNDLVLDFLYSLNGLPLPTAISLTQFVSTVEPNIDVILCRRLQREPGAAIDRIGHPQVLRVLSILDASSSCHRVVPWLQQALRHPHSHVRSKAALLFGRANTNLARFHQFMESPDHRIRANAVESLWGCTHRDAITCLRNISTDHHHRVRVNALLGLVWAGDEDALAQLKDLSSNGTPPFRAAAQWALKKCVEGDGPLRPK